MGSATVKIYDDYFTWASDNVGDLGADATRWKDLYFSGRIYNANDFGVVFYENDIISYENEIVLF